MIQNTGCDGDHCREAHGEVRILPLPGDANLYLCRPCFRQMLKRQILSDPDDDPSAGNSMLTKEYPMTTRVTIMNHGPDIVTVDLVRPVESPQAPTEMVHVGKFKDFYVYQQHDIKITEVKYPDAPKYRAAALRAASKRGKS